jgi:RNA polymerase subunit RPABC4/transcription elongation factor Spt4
MRVYRLSANVNNYRILLAVEGRVIDHYRRFNGMPLEDPSEPLPVVFELENADTPVGDFPGLTSHIPVFSRRGAEVLGAWLSAAGDLVPLRCRDGDDAYVGLNVTQRVDALDVERSRVKRFRSGRIMQILRHAFVAERLRDVAIFKIPETAVQDVYVRHPFAAAVAGSGLRGFVFELRWIDAPFLILCPYCLGIIEETTARCPTCGLDTRRDAPWEVTPDELFGMERRRCPSCGVRIRNASDPCPYCKEGERRQGVRTGVVIV